MHSSPLAQAYRDSAQCEGCVLSAEKVKTLFYFCAKTFYRRSSSFVTCISFSDLTEMKKMSKSFFMFSLLLLKKSVKQSRQNKIKEFQHFLLTYRAVEFVWCIGAVRWSITTIFRVNAGIVKTLELWTRALQLLVIRTSCCVRNNFKRSGIHSYSQCWS